MSQELDDAVARAVRTTVQLHTLMAAHQIPSFQYLHLLLQWPAGLQHAYGEWVASMAAVVNALGHLEGIQGTAALSVDDKVRLTHRAFSKVMELRT